MNNDFIEKYKNEPDVKRLLDELKEKEKQQEAQKQVTRNRLRSGSAGGAANPDIRQPWKLLMHL